MSDVFQRIGKLRPSRNAFDLSYSKLGTCMFGELIPIMCDEVVPHDTIKLGVEAIIRFQPMITPILHEVSLTVHYFFVPYRLLTGWTYVNSAKQHVFDWELFITGGVTGQYNIPLPRWNPSETEINPSRSVGWQDQLLWNMFGFPAATYLTTASNPDVTPMAFPMWAYNLIYFEYYRDQDMQGGTQGSPFPPFSPVWGNRNTAFRNWRKDYFTSARPWQQRGVMPALPIRGNAPVGLVTSSTGQYWNSQWVDNMLGFVNANNQQVGMTTQDYQSAVPTAFGAATKLDLAATFNVSDLRLSFQLQKWMERNARAGIRYTEFLRSHFGVAPSDARLDRPEYIGGHKSFITISEVLQTSQSNPNAPQANMAGHGLNASVSHVANYHVTEYGLIMGMMSVMPKASYQQGINRQWLRYSKFDFYFPEFAHLSEQGIYRAELFWQNQTAPDGSHFLGNSRDSQIFGFQGHYDEMRVKHDMVVGEMRNYGADLSMWHLGRYFTNEPLLNGQFISMSTYENWKNSFAVQDRRPIIFHVGNRITAIRPMPYIAEPGLVDHF